MKEWATLLEKEESGVEALFLLATSIGSKTILKRLADHDISGACKRRAFSQAAEKGHLDCLKYLYKTCQADISMECKEEAFKWVGASDSEASLAYLDEQYGSEMSIETKRTAFKLAAIWGSLSCLHYLSHRYEEKFCWDTKKNALFSMLRENHLPALKIFWEKWEGGISNLVKKALLADSLCAQVDCLQYLNERCKAMLSPDDKILLFEIAAKMDLLDALKYIYEQYKDFVPTQVKKEAIQGNIKEAFKTYLMKQGSGEMFVPASKTPVITPFLKEKENIDPIKQNSDKNAKVRDIARV